MANWTEKFNRVTQTAISKSKEMAEITRLNMEISNFTQSRKEIYMQIGEHVLKNDLLSEDEAIFDLKERVVEINTGIHSNEEKIKEIKNINICPDCGAEVSRSSRFCDKCGTEMLRMALEEPVGMERTCQNCGEILEGEAMFCGKCGCRQE